MNKDQTTHGAFASALTRSKRRPAVRLWISGLLLALCLIGLNAAAFAQAECLDACQHALSDCLRNGQGDPAAETICEDIYDACCEACMGL